MRLLQRLGDTSTAATALMVVEPIQLADALVLAVLEAGAAPAAVQPKGKAAAADAVKLVSRRLTSMLKSSMNCARQMCG
jgi:hypothetical protein